MQNRTVPIAVGLLALISYIRRTIRGFVFAEVLTLFSLIWVAMPAQATVRIWNGATNPYWSEPSNWSPSGAPQNGDDLVFVDGAAHQVNLNDQVGLQINSITFNGTTSSYTLTGNAIGLFNGISCQLPGALANFNISVTLLQDQTF